MVMKLVFRKTRETPLISKRFEAKTDCLASIRFLKMAGEDGQNVSGMTNFLEFGLGVDSTVIERFLMAYSVFAASFDF
jgi:hypothetical protein